VDNNSGQTHKYSALTLLKTKLFVDILVYVLLAVILCGVFNTGMQAIKNEKRMTFDGTLYDFLSSQILKDPFNYSPKQFWRLVKNTMPEGTAKNIAEVYLDEPIFKHPPVFTYSISLAKMFFGNKVLISRCVPNAFRIMTILIFFMIGKYMFGNPAGLLAAFFISLEPVYMFCSQKVWIETSCGFFLFLGVWMLMEYSRKNIMLYVSAAALGLALMCKYVAVFGIIPVYVFLLISDHIKDRKTLITYMTIPFLVCLPWIFWNYKVFGAGFINNIISLNSSDLSPISGGYVAVVMLFVSICMLLVFLAALNKKRIKQYFYKIVQPLKGKVPSYITGRTLNYFVFACVLMLFIVSVPSILKALSWSYIPGTSDSPDMFPGVAINFYFAHLIELSPIYMLSFMSLFYIFKWDKNMFLLAGVSIASVLFLTSFSCYETRYVAIVTPGLFLMAAYTVIETFKLLNAQESGNKTMNLCLFFMIIFFMVSKTIAIDLGLVLKNNFIFF
jgi:Dolichyl-phosphate-mannose-protein mannosyltransferase